MLVLLLTSCLYVFFDLYRVFKQIKNIVTNSNTWKYVCIRCSTRIFSITLLSFKMLHNILYSHPSAGEIETGKAIYLSRTLTWGNWLRSLHWALPLHISLTIKNCPTLFALALSGPKIYKKLVKFLFDIVFVFFFISYIYYYMFTGT